MTERDFDECPTCGSYGQFGLRSHPKFATCIAGKTGGEPDMVMVYFHSQEHNDNFAESTEEVLYKQRWNAETKKWEDYP